ncbi:hypothetical protein ANCDUO_23113, partial [Ancylostoma duodenale]
MAMLFGRPVTPPHIAGILYQILVTPAPKFLIGFSPDGDRPGPIAKGLLTVPKDTVPADWVIENEVVDPQMATSYVTESLVGPASARGSSYTYTYESHYDNPPDDDDEDRYAAVEGSATHQTHKITRVTKVTTTRSVRQIPVGSPYSDIYFDASGLPTPSPVVEIEAPLDELGIRLQRENEEGRSAPPPAPPLGSRYVNVAD